MKNFTFVGVFFVSLLLFSCASVPPAPIVYLDSSSADLKEPLPRLAIVQGATDSARTEIGVLHKASEKLDISLWDSQSKSKLQAGEAKDYGGSESDLLMTQINFSGLQPKVDYWLQVHSNGKLVDLRKLRALDTSETTVTFAIVSCMDDEYPEQKEMWAQLVAQKPDVLFFIGDNVYADKKIPDKKSTPATLWKRYAETRQLLEVFRAETLTPVFVTWDDHDYGVNDGDRTFLYKDKSLEIMNAFFPRAPLPGVLDTGPAATSHLRAFGQDFIFLDSRYYRSAPQDGNVQTHWGVEQEKWLWDEVAEAKGAVWLFNGDQFFGKYHTFESFEGRHPQAFAAFLKKARASKNPLILVSGDRHLAEIQKISPKDIGYTTYELTSSGMHAKVYPDQWVKFPNKRKLEGKDNAFNYMLVTSKPKGKGVEFTVTSYGQGGVVHFKRSLSVKR